LVCDSHCHGKGATDFPVAFFYVLDDFFRVVFHPSGFGMYLFVWMLRGLDWSQIFALAVSFFVLKTKEFVFDDSRRRGALIDG
jgi:hypothetical protein